jgi:uncharacterized ParB-like nuclease family protein
MRSSLFALAFFSLTLPAFGQGVDPLIGTWKLNLEKSTFTGRAPPKSRTATWAGEGQNLAVTIEGVEAKGQPLKLIFRHIYDEQPHPVIGSPDNESNSYLALFRIGNSINGTFFKDGKVVGLTQVQLVPGKTVTLIEEGIDAGDLPYHDVLVFERQ